MTEDEERQRLYLEGIAKPLGGLFEGHFSTVISIVGIAVLACLLPSIYEAGRHLLG